MFAFFVASSVPLFFPQSLARFPCANDGVLSSDIENGGEPSDSAFGCQCPEGFYGTFCEYLTSPADDDPGIPKIDQQQKLSTLVDKFGVLFPPGSVPADSERRVVVDWHWQDAVVNLLVCVFFLLILPSLVVYIVRILYLFLKRCHQRNRTTPPATIEPTAMPTPPPQYYPPMGDPFRPNPSGRYRSESPGIAEVTVQLPASVCRPLHGTHSLNIRPTTSLTLHEFHSLLLAMQREMQAEQRRECENQSRRMASSPAIALPPVIPPVGPPPNYECALLSSHCQ